MVADLTEIDVRVLWLKDPASEADASSALAALLRGEVLTSPSEICVIAEAALTDAGDSSLGKSLLWVAASLGSRRACSLLATQIEALIAASDDVSSAHHRRLVSLAATWRRNAGALRFHDLSKLERMDRDEAHWSLEVLERAKRPPPVNGVVVVPDVADGDDARQRYGSIIGEKIPLKAVTRDGVASRVLRQWPWTVELAARLEERAAFARSIGGSLAPSAPLLIVGPNGVGKTSIANEIAAAMGLPTIFISAAAPADGNPLAAVSREWRNARPSAVIGVIHREKCANPLVIVDDIDKSSMAPGRPGSIEMTLAAMIDHPHRYHDAFLMTDVDLSSVNFIATATDHERLSPGTLDRFEIVRVPRPNEEHLPMIVATIIGMEADRFGVRPEMLPRLPEGGMRTLCEVLRNGGSLRTITRAYRRLVSLAVAAGAEEASAIN